MRRLLLVALAVMVTGAHVGDNNTYFRGTAGPYAVQLTVRHPGVVPGLADILVRVSGDVQRVTVRPVKFPLGIEGAPRPDVAQAVPGSPGLYSAELWFMECGAYSVHLTVEGAAGTGVLAVPVNSLATERLQLSRGLEVALAALGLLLATGLITIVRAAVRESVVPPGATPSARHVRRGRIATVGAAAFVATVLWGGAAWWDLEDTAYGELMWQPFRIDTRVHDTSGARRLVLAITDERWLERAWTPIVPDHGRMMHLFLVRLPAMDAFAHLHPAAVHSDTFQVTLPHLPDGRYALYADVLHESGFGQTMTDTVVLGDAGATAEAEQTHAERGAGGADAAHPITGDEADAVWMNTDPTASQAHAALLAPGVSLTWERPVSITAGEELELRFVARATDGTPVQLEPYLGMPAHAVVRRDDGAVFVHLHSTGTVPVAAQEAQTAQLAGTAPPARGTTHQRHDTVGDIVTIPYAFPQPGRYRLWVQVRYDGAVRTGAWDVTVSAQ